MHCQQLHSAWEPAQSACVVLNAQSSKKPVIAALVSDVVLLLQWQRLGQSGTQRKKLILRE
jgi:hypothetical protein